MPQEDEEDPCAFTETAGSVIIPLKQSQENLEKMWGGNQQTNNTVEVFTSVN